MSYPALKLRTPAKINPVLEVLGRRPDGFHELVLLFQAIDLTDEISLSPTRSGVRLEIDPVLPELPPDGSNLASRAAELFLKEVREGKDGVEIQLKKGIPLAAGLGGGSSDAAAVLWGMNELFQAGLNLDRLQNLAARLGSDVPFFLAGGFAIGRGRGEKIQSLPPGPCFSLVLVKPTAGLSTARVFQSGRALLSSGEKASDFSRIWEKGSLGDIGKNLFNGLEPAALSLMPEVGEIRKRLMDSGAAGALLSGSGPTVFGLAHGPETALEIAERVKKPGWDVWVTRTIPGGIEKIST